MKQSKEQDGKCTHCNGQGCLYCDAKKQSKEMEELLEKILFEYDSWYVDEGDYQPTEEEAVEKIRQAINNYTSQNFIPKSEVEKELKYQKGQRDYWKKHTVEREEQFEAEAKIELLTSLLKK